MMTSHKIILLAALVGAFLLSACEQEGLYSGNLILEGDHHLSSGESMRGVLVMLDGRLFIEEDARLTGPVYMMAGRLENHGEISSDISLLGGRLILGPSARLGGDLNIGGGDVERDPSAQIAGQVVTAIGLQVPDRPTLFRETLREQLLSWLIQSVILGIMAYFTVRWLPVPVSRVSKAIVEHPLVSLAIGVLAGIVGLVLLVLMAFTIILIPVSFLFGFLILLAVIFGWIGFGSAIGRFLLKLFKWELSQPMAAALGTLLFVFIWNMLALIPIVQGVIPLILAVTGLGAVFITRFGLSEFIPATDLDEPEF
jgi:hypothetical protein